MAELQHSEESPGSLLIAPGSEEPGAERGYTPGSLIVIAGIEREQRKMRTPLCMRPRYSLGLYYPTGFSVMMESLSVLSMGSR